MLSPANPKYSLDLNQNLLKRLAADGRSVNKFCHVVGVALESVNSRIHELLDITKNRLKVLPVKEYNELLKYLFE